MREIDRCHNVDDPIPLMVSAAAVCFDVIHAHFSGHLDGKQALILCGKGNNGGDGAALALSLAAHGVKCTLVLFGKYAETRGDAETYFGYVKRRSGSELFTFIECDNESVWDEFTKPYAHDDLIVDALFGTGLTRPLEGVYLKVLEYLSELRQWEISDREKRPWVLSIDIPSGLNADSAQPIGPAVMADATATFTAPKVANVLPPACFFGGEVFISDIGLSVSSVHEIAKPWLFVTQGEDARQWLISTRYVPGSYKNTHGHTLIAAGSRGYSGAAVLSGDAAMRSGAGLVTVATPVSAQASIASAAMPEVMTTALAETDRGAISDEAVDHFLKLAQKATVVAVGPGLTSDDERTRRFVESIVERRSTPCVIDADGLNCLSPWPRELGTASQHPLVLTPHQGEMRRLMGGGEITDPVQVVREFAMTNQVILVLKGSRSIVGAPDGRVFVNPVGNPGLGTAGSGDTLTGLIAGFLAQAFATLKDRADALTAVLAALYVGGLAGDLAARRLGMRTMVASDIREHFSEAIRVLDPDGERSRWSFQDLKNEDAGP